MKHTIKCGSPRKTVANRAKNFEMLMEHFTTVCEPFYYVKVDPVTYEQSVKPSLNDMIDEEKSLQNLVA